MIRPIFNSIGRFFKQLVRHDVAEVLPGVAPAQSEKAPQTKRRTFRFGAGSRGAGLCVRRRRTRDLTRSMHQHQRRMHV